MENREGQPVPEVVFRARKDGEWHDINSQKLFKNRRVVVFALPGAFTPTCSTSHLPRYSELAERIRKEGIDEIVCLSVNDGFVMEAWAKDQPSEGITLVPDGNGEFSRGMGMLVDKSDLGFGQRSWRYSMIVNDGIIERMFIEEEKPGDPYEVSDADTLLAYLAPSTTEHPLDVSVFSRPGCPHCTRAKALLDKRGIDYEEIVLGDGISTDSLRAVSGRATVPQIFMDGQHIGGADDLEAYFAT